MLLRFSASMKSSPNWLPRRDFTNDRCAQPVMSQRSAFHADVLPSDKDVDDAMAVWGLIVDAVDGIENVVHGIDLGGVEGMLNVEHLSTCVV